MNKNEFEERAKVTVTDQEYSIIDKVYTWHPSISNTEGKEQIVMLYKNFGMNFIQGMVEAADMMINLDREEREAIKKLDAIQRRKDMVTEGNLQYERCKSEMLEAFSSCDSAPEFERVVKAIGSNYDTDTVMQIRKECAI